MLSDFLVVFVLQPPHQVRAVQRRLGLLASASDLSEEFKQKLRGIRAALEQQRVCNAAVDAVVSEEVVLILACRPPRVLVRGSLVSSTTYC